LILGVDSSYWRILNELFLGDFEIPLEFDLFLKISTVPDISVFRPYIFFFSINAVFYKLKSFAAAPIFGLSGIFLIVVPGLFWNLSFLLIVKILWSSGVFFSLKTFSLTVVVDSAEFFYDSNVNKCLFGFIEFIFM
jgi:hypothetical protein